MNDFPIVVVGTGFSGIAMGVALKGAGIDSFVILEKAGDVGGTWRDNTYPGAACDVPSHLYCFSFEPKPDWSRSFSPQQEIHAYLKHCVEKYDLARHIRFHQEVTGAEFDEASGTWTVRMAGGEPLRARAVVLGNGALHVPALPDIPGRDSFEGRLFHSAQWDHAYPLAGKRVAVIGTGASAIQFVPEIAPGGREAPGLPAHRAVDRAEGGPRDAPVREAAVRLAPSHALAAPRAPVLDGRADGGRLRGEPEAA